ncbi:hypothetical protein J6590_000069 [Homalodisca vitripennis]|nr:hypothetical protein J6590_000069 [Homalodisca vitripennis]
MTAICFVCNLPILSHQVGLVWMGGNGWDDMVREQVEESTLRSRLGAGRRDSSAQITSISPPTETQETSPPVSARRRRSSLAQLTDILREWGGSTTKTRGSKPLVRRETLADLARSLPWAKPSESGSSYRKRRESSADSGVKSASTKSRRESGSTIAADIARIWRSREHNTVIVASTERRRSSVESHRSGRRDSNALQGGSRRGSGESAKSGRRDSNAGVVPSPPKLPHQHSHRHHQRRKSRPTVEPPPTKYYRDDQRPSTSSTASDSAPVVLNLTTTTTESGCGSGMVLPPPTISLTSSVTPPPTSPAGPTTPVSGVAPSSPTAVVNHAVSPGAVPPPMLPNSNSVATPTTTATTTPTHPLINTRRDSTTQLARIFLIPHLGTVPSFVPILGLWLS